MRFARRTFHRERSPSGIARHLLCMLDDAGPNKLQGGAHINSPSSWSLGPLKDDTGWTCAHTKKKKSGPKFETYGKTCEIHFVANTHPVILWQVFLYDFWMTIPNLHFVASDDPGRSGRGNVPRVYERCEIHFVEISVFCLKSLIHKLKRNQGSKRQHNDEPSFCMTLRRSVMTPLLDVRSWSRLSLTSYENPA